LQSTSALIVNPAGLEETAMQMSGPSRLESQNGTVQMNLIPRDGGNRYSATASVNYSNDGMQSDNISPALLARGSTGVLEAAHWSAPSTEALEVPSSGIGCGSTRRHEQNRLSKFMPGLFANATPDGWFYTANPSQQATKEDDERDHSYRLTWQITNKNKLSVLVMLDGHCLCPYVISTTSSPEAASRFNQTLPLFQGKWSYPASNRLLFEAGATARSSSRTSRTAPGVTKDTISVLESTTNFRYRSMANNYGPDEIQAGQSEVRRVYVTGSHAFKVGSQTLQGWRIDPYLGERRHQLHLPRRRSAQRDGVVRDAAGAAGPGERSGDLRAGPVDDRRWTLSLGVRYDSFVGSIRGSRRRPVRSSERATSLR
jgi:hypothetical protein